MKPAYIFFLLILATYGLTAQNCAKPTAFADLHVNNIQASILTGGDLFTNSEGDTGKMIYLPDPAQPTTLFGASFWIGGLDVAGNLKISSSAYRYNHTDFVPGPLDAQTGLPIQNACEDWDRLFVVTADEIAQFQSMGANLSTLEKIQQFPNIMGWPGRNNPFFTLINDFSIPDQTSAPFFDADNDAVYNPEQGDYPVVMLRGKAPFLPDQIIWCVMNDRDLYESNLTNPLGIQMELTAWAFNCSEAPVLNNTIFTSHKLIYRGTEVLDSCYVGLFTDFDLGCYIDDYAGCNLERNTQFCYNADAVDGSNGNSCFGMNNASFVNAPPVQTVTYLDFPLEKYMVIRGSASPAAMSTPELPGEYYNYLTGRWRDGNPLTEGGNGYNVQSTDETSWTFPGDPASVSAWSMCTEALALDDIRAIGSSSIGQLSPGEVNEFTVAWGIYDNPSLPCNLGEAMDKVSAVQVFFDNAFNLCGSLLSPTAAPGIAPISVYPNPTTHWITLQLGAQTAESLRIVSATGQIMQSFQQITGDFTLSTSHLPAGRYTLQAFTTDGEIMTGTFVQIGQP